MNITLIGMAGSGKSLIGKKLALRLNYKFVDVDGLMEEQKGLKLQDLINKFGDDYFRNLEEKTILGLGEIEQTVISPGGSVIYSQKAMDFLKRRSFVVFLNAPFDVISKRIDDSPMRGIIGLRGKDLKDLFMERCPRYMKYADATVDVSEKIDPEDIINQIIQNL